MADLNKYNFFNFYYMLKEYIQQTSFFWSLGFVDVLVSAQQGVFLESRWGPSGVVLKWEEGDQQIQSHSNFNYKL